MRANILICWQTGKRRGRGRDEGMEVWWGWGVERDIGTLWACYVLCMCFWNLKATPQWHTSSSKAVLFKPSKTVPLTVEKRMKSPMGAIVVWVWLGSIDPLGVVLLGMALLEWVWLCWRKGVTRGSLWGLRCSSQTWCLTLFLLTLNPDVEHRNSLAPSLPAYWHATMLPTVTD